MEPTAITIYRVWWTPNIPGEPFYFMTSSINQAIETLRLLSSYDFFLGDLIQSNAGGLEVFEEGEWGDWCDDEEGNDINYYLKRLDEINIQEEFPFTETPKLPLVTPENPVEAPEHVIRCEWVGCNHREAGICHKPGEVYLTPEGCGGYDQG